MARTLFHPKLTPHHPAPRRSTVLRSGEIGHGDGLDLSGGVSGVAKVIRFKSLPPGRIFSPASPHGAQVLNESNARSGDSFRHSGVYLPSSEEPFLRLPVDTQVARLMTGWHSQNRNLNRRKRRLIDAEWFRLCSDEGRQKTSKV